MRKAVLRDCHEGRSEAGRQCSLSGGTLAIIKPYLKSHVAQECPVISPPSTKSPFPSLVPWQSWLCLGAVRITLPPAHQSPLQKVRHQSGGWLNVTVLNQPLLYGNECSTPLGTWKWESLPSLCRPQVSYGVLFQLRPESDQTLTQQGCCPRKSKIRLTAMLLHQITLPLNM